MHMMFLKRNAQNETSNSLLSENKRKKQKQGLLKKFLPKTRKYKNKSRKKEVIFTCLQQIFCLTTITQAISA